MKVTEREYDFLTYCSAILGIRHHASILTQVAGILETRPPTEETLNEIFAEGRIRREANPKVAEFYYRLRRAYPDYEYKKPIPDDATN